MQVNAYLKTKKARDVLAGFLQFEARCSHPERRADLRGANRRRQRRSYGDRGTGQRIERPVSVRLDATVALVIFVFVRGVSTLS